MSAENSVKIRKKRKIKEILCRNSNNVAFIIDFYRILAIIDVMEVCL